MGIDKSTGKGCAWSLASKTVADQLVTEGIIGKLIYREKRKSTYDLVRVIDQDRYYVRLHLDRVQELADEPIWLPTYVEPSRWKRAVGRFQTAESLDRNVERFLLPEMGDYLQNLSEAELLSITKNFLLESGVIQTPIRQRAGKTYYFNENEIYSLDQGSQLFPYEGRAKFEIFHVRDTCFNMRVWNKAASQFEVGMTLDHCIKIFLDTELGHSAPREPSPLDRLIQHIGPPVYERVPENRDKATFDRVRITVGLSRYQYPAWEDLKREVNKYRRDICRQVVRKLEDDRQFRGYGVPMNFIKLSNVTLLRDFSLDFIFELKEISDEAPEDQMR